MAGAVLATLLSLGGANVRHYSTTVLEQESLDMAEYQQNFLAALQGGLNLGQQIRGVQDRNRLNQLAQTAYTAPPEQRDSLLGQMAGVDARAAQQQEQAFANTDERRNRTMVNMAKLLMSAPEQARPALYQRFVPTLSGFGLSDLPGEYNAQTSPIISQAAQSIVRAYSGEDLSNPYSGLPADIQSLRILQENPELAKLDRERRQASGMVPKLVQTQEGIGWGTPGGGISLAPLQGVAGSSPPQQVDPNQLFAALSSKYSIQPTSVRRTPEHNRAVGGVANSYHISGQAADFVVPAQYKQQFIQDAQQHGYQALDEGDHIHIEPSRQAPRNGGVAQPYRSPPSAPAGYREVAGGLEVIPGGPADKPEAAPKPIPAGILRMRRDSREALSVAEGMGSEIANVRSQLKNGQIQLGPMQNQIYRARNAAGQSDAQSRAYQGMLSTFEKLRNDSLRLNNGVQTEGDAQRAWSELLGNLGDNTNVDEQLQRIERINQRAIQLHTENMDEIDGEYGDRSAPGRTAAPSTSPSDFSNLWN